MKIAVIYMKMKMFHSLKWPSAIFAGNREIVYMQSKQED